MINLGGKKVSPVEIEKALLSHPGVKDCACTAIDDPSGISGEVPAVLAILDQPHETKESDLRRHLKNILEPYMIPVYWYFSGEIPRTDNGKIQRSLLRKRFEETQRTARRGKD